MTTMPTARDIFPSGTPGYRCEDYNRRRKSFIIATELFREHGGRISEGEIQNMRHVQMDLAAESAGEHVPGGPETRNMIREELRRLGGLPAKTDQRLHAEGGAIAHPSSGLDLDQITALLSRGTPVVLVPVRAE
ncbi:hypothetical protein [Streptomyces sp. NPDC015125]|uniref:hypothetical protein n=1 Tax=Streptomyces sp. NPDC015125 TaxID=3364938 RepID=UPI0036F4BC29